VLGDGKRDRDRRQGDARRHPQALPPNYRQH
jgi:hypothetical protein